MCRPQAATPVDTVKSLQIHYQYDRLSVLVRCLLFKSKGRKEAKDNHETPLHPKSNGQPQAGPQAPTEMGHVQLLGRAGGKVPEKTNVH